MGGFVIREERKLVRTAEEIQDEIARLLRRLADPVVAGESVKACIRRASQRAGLPYGQTKRLWYREWRDIPAFVADNIRERADKHDRKLKHAAFQAIIALQDSDPDYYRQCIEEVGDILLPVSGKRRASGASD
jgi:hypothetical protein